jgi:cytochrome c553
MLRIFVILLGGVFLAESVFAADDSIGDPAVGRKLASQCRTCHGLDGYAKIPIAPHIGGEPASYISGQLRAFRSGERKHEMMTVVAATLDEQKIVDVAAWYASLEAKAITPEDIDLRKKPEVCVTCHGEDGISLAMDAPNLAAESIVYISTQLKAFRNGKRKHPVMTAIAANLSDEDIRAVSKWYSAIELKINTP